MPPKETIWAAEEHTFAKHRLLRRYLDAWLPIMARHNRRLVLVDGFAGPGRYSGANLARRLSCSTLTSVTPIARSFPT